MLLTSPVAQHPSICVAPCSAHLLRLLIRRATMFETNSLQRAPSRPPALRRKNPVRIPSFSNVIPPEQDPRAPSPKSKKFHAS